MVMELRWYVEINQYGQRTEPELQYLNENGEWKSIECQEVKIESDKPWSGR